MAPKAFRLAACLLATACTALAALPQVAVLDAVVPDDMDYSVVVPITDKISEALVNSGKYTVLDRVAVEQVLKEKEFQLSGLVKTEEIRKAGEYLGADFVVASRAARIGALYFISARMIDVRSGAIKAQTSVERQGGLEVLLSIAGAVGTKLAGGVVETVEERRLEGPARPRPAPAQPPAPAAPAPAPRPAPEPAPTPTAAEVPQVLLGIKGGLNIADAYGDDAYADTLPGQRWVGGAYMSVRVGEVGFELDLLYSQKGYDYDFFDTVHLDDVHNVWTFDYLELAVLGKLYAGRTAPLYLAVGLYMGFYITGTVTVEYATKTHLDVKPKIEDVRDVSDIDLGGLLGFGLDVPLGKSALNLEMRLGMGFTSWLASGTNTPKHLVLSLLGGFGFSP